jgi:hypothetical protein
MKKKLIIVLLSPKKNNIYSKLNFQVEVSLLKLDIDNNKDYLFVNGDFHLTNEIIDKLYNNFLDTNSKIMSPMIICKDKLIYCGGIVNDAKVVYFNEDIISLQKVLNDKRFFKHIFKTMLPYEKLFFIRGEFYDKTKNIFNLSIELKSVTVDAYNTITQINNDDDNQTHNQYINNDVFKFESNCIKEILDEYTKQNFFSLKFCKKKNLHINDNKNILIIEQCPIRPDRDCGAVYMFYIIKVLIELSFNVYYCSQNHEYDEKYTQMLQKLGVYVFFEHPWSIEIILKNNYNLFDYVLINRLEGMNDTYDLVKKYCLDAKIIYNTHDVHFIRNERESIIMGTNLDIKEKNKEIEYMRKADIVNIVSLYEYDYLRKNYLDLKIQYLPICYPTDDSVKRNVIDTRDIYFIGSRHPPNVDCITFFIENVWEKINNIDKNIKLHVIGSCCKKIEDLYKNIPNVKFWGMVSDMHLNIFFKKIRLCLAPLRYGAGVKGKILQSSQYMIPAITTNVGYEGTEFVKDESILVFDNMTKENSDEFAKYIVEKYYNLENLGYIGNNAFNVMKNYYSLEKCKENCIELFYKLEKTIINTEIQSDKKKKICVMLNCYYDHHIIYDIIDDFKIITNDVIFDYYLINNNDKKSMAEYENICHVIDGDNTSYEFSGIQKCINILKNNGKINEYVAFIIMTDKLMNHPMSYTMKINKDIIENALNNEIAIGLIDSWDDEYNVDDFSVKNWIRTNFVIINKILFEKIDYVALSYNVEKVFDGDKFKINIDNGLKNKLEGWLNQERYSKLNNEQKKLKMCSILNEYKLSYKLKKNGEILSWR